MTDLRPVHEAVFRSQPEERAGSISDIRGTIPPELRGTFLRSGPGLMQVGSDSLNFFDGHALIAGVTFEGGAARFRSRFVRSPLYLEETAAQRLKKRRVFTNLPARWSNFFALELGNSAMHDVFSWGGKVVASNDPGHFALDPRTFEPLGPARFGGAVRNGQEMSPMPYRDPKSGRLVGWIKKVGGTSPDALSFVELDERFAVVTQTPFHRLAASPVIVHDQRATERFYVAVEQAARLSAGKAIWGASTIYDSFQTPPLATATLLLVPRGREGALVRVPLPAPFEVAFHVINAFDEGEGRLVVDLVAYGGRIGFSAAAPRALRDRTGAEVVHGPVPTPTRFVIDTAAGRVVESKKLGELPGEAPEVSDAVMGAPYRFAYFPTSRPDANIPDRGGYFFYGGVSKLDVESGQTRAWFAEGDAVVSPVSFVARPSASDEDDGWLLVYVLREAETEVVVLDARALDAGPVATIGLGTRLPGVSHVRWAADVMLAP
jgi:all-trans-8'-apo-beta-carotenal 15,15'-oxygenase